MIELFNGSVHLPTEIQGTTITLVSLNAAPGKVSLYGDHLMVTAPARVFRPGALQVLAEALCSVIAQVFGCEQSDFEVDSGIYCDSQKICRAICRVTCSQVLQAGKLRAVIDTFTRSLLPIEICTQHSLLVEDSSNELNNENHTQIAEAANSVLSKVGGSPITYPCSLFIGDQKIGEIRGVFAPRPPIENQPEQLTVRAAVDGYRRQKRAAYLILDDGRSVTANWANDNDFDVVRDMATTLDSYIDIKLVRAMDAKGNEVYTLVP